MVYKHYRPPKFHHQYLLLSVVLIPGTYANICVIFKIPEVLTVKLCPCISEFAGQLGGHTYIELGTPGSAVTATGRANSVPISPQGADGRQVAVKCLELNNFGRPGHVMKYYAGLQT
jgi:hypothetical protein